jgi:protein disulfide-isomerase A1
MFEFLGAYFSKQYLFIALAVVAFLAIGYYVYTSYVQPKINPAYIENNEFTQEGPPKEVELYFFYTEWCPHCKAAKPEWAKLKEEYEGKTINNTSIIFREVDCDKEEKVADEFNVEGYPTIKMVKDSEIIEYNAKPNYDTLVEFLHSTL